MLDHAFIRAQTVRPSRSSSRASPGSARRPSPSAWIDRLGAETVVLSARCDQLSRSLPLQPVLQMIRNHLRRVGADMGA